MELNRDLSHLLVEYQHAEPARQQLLRDKYGRHIPEGQEPQILFRFVGETTWRLGTLGWYMERTPAEGPYFRLVTPDENSGPYSQENIVVYSSDMATRVAEWYVLPK